MFGDLNQILGGGARIFDGWSVMVTRQAAVSHATLELSPKPPSTQVLGSTPPSHSRVTQLCGQPPSFRACRRMPFSKEGTTYPFCTHNRKREREAREQRWHFEGVSPLSCKSSSSPREGNQENQSIQTSLPRLGWGLRSSWLKGDKKRPTGRGGGVQKAVSTGGPVTLIISPWRRHLFSKQECSRKLQTA